MRRRQPAAEVRDSAPLPAPAGAGTWRGRTGPLPGALGMPGVGAAAFPGFALPWSATVWSVVGASSVMVSSALREPSAFWGANTIVS